MTSEIVVYHNVDPDYWFRYKRGHELRKVFEYESEKEYVHEAAEEAFWMFVMESDEIHGATEIQRDTAARYHALGIRPLRNGDVLLIGERWLAVAALGFVDLLDHEPAVVEEVHEP